MSKLPSPEDIGIPANEDCKYNFEQASRILEAMDFLRREAVDTRIPEIIDMIDASFRLLLTSYYCIRRYEMGKLPAAGERDKDGL
jgi:hypothetical protein